VSSPALRVGLAGAGRFGQLHASVLSQLPGCQLVALADPDPQTLAAVADRHGVAERRSDAFALIHDDSLALDAVVLATPDEQHPPQVRAALARRLPVFVEKPLAGGWQEAAALQALAEQSGTLLQVGMVLRYELSHRLLHQQLSAGAFGDLVSIRCQRNCSRSSYAAIADRVHTVFRTLIHDIDLLLWLSGSRVLSVTALEFRQGDHLAPQGCFALLQLANGGVAQLESSWTVPDQAPANVITAHWHSTIDAELAVVGTLQTVKLQGLQSGLQIWTDQQLQCPDRSLWPQLDGRVHGALQAQLQDFLACVRQGSPSAIASLADAVEGLRVAEALIESARLETTLQLG
jgi:predicted dehydrogenase